MIGMKNGAALHHFLAAIFSANAVTWLSMAFSVATAKLTSLLSVMEFCRMALMPTPLLSAASPTSLTIPKASEQLIRT